MFVKMEVTFSDLMEMSWAGAKDVLEKVREEGRQNEVMELLEEIFYGDIPEDTTVNDFLWFDLPDIINLHGDNEEE